MPIVIDEVVISVEAPGEAAAAPSAPGATQASVLSEDERRRLVAECVECVFELLAQRKEP
jgi:hypothetical protein